MKVRGAREYNDDYKRRFVFRCDQSEEVFDLSAMTLLASFGMKFPGLPDLKEVGFLTQSGKVIRYGNVAKDVFILKFAKENPKEVGEALIFSGLLEGDFEIKLKGKTPVCRVDLKEEGRDLTLWKNIP